MPNLPCSTSAHETLYAKDGVLIKTCFYFFFPCVIIRDFEGEICMKLVRLPFRFPLLFPNISLWEHHLHLHVLLNHINLTTNFSLFRHNLKCEGHEKGSFKFLACIIYIKEFGRNLVGRKKRELVVAGWVAEFRFGERLYCNVEKGFKDECCPRCRGSRCQESVVFVVQYPFAFLLVKCCDSPLGSYRSTSLSL